MNDYFMKDIKLVKQSVGKVLTLDNNKVITSSDVNISDVSDALISVEDLEERVTNLEGTAEELSSRIIEINGEEV